MKPPDAGKVTPSWSWDTALQGVIPPMISPLNESGDSDETATCRLVEHILAGGCSGLFVLGGCGGGAYLTPGQRATVIRAAAHAAAGRVPVLVGCMLPATGSAIEAGRHARDLGTDALVIGSPYYYPVDESMQRHVETIVQEIPLPILLYNIPQATLHPVSPATVATLARDARVLGIKDSAGNFEAFLRMVAVKKTRPAFRVLQGNESLAAASLLHGGDGLVPGLANLVPALFVSLREAARVGDVYASPGSG
jgi:4-hydroxy-tetrahydrodipicolinate synthase